MRVRTRTAGGIALMLLSLSLSGCQLVALPFLMWGQPPTKDVPAKYPYLADKKVCIVVWADMNTLFEYPYVQGNVAEHVRAAMTDGVTGISFIPNRQVIEMQERDPDWDRTNEATLGARFGAERVLMIELTQYTMREPDSPHLYRGRISANVKVFDTAHPKAAAAYKTTVETVYPPDSVGQWGSDERSIHRATLEAFANQLAGHFYDRKVRVR